MIITNNTKPLRIRKTTVVSDSAHSALMIGTTFTLVLFTVVTRVIVLTAVTGYWVVDVLVVVTVRVTSVVFIKVVK